MTNENNKDTEHDLVHNDLAYSIKHHAKLAFLLFVPVYYLIHPEDLAVLIVDYLKLHPSSVADMIQYASPPIAGVLTGIVVIKVALFIFLLFFLLLSLGSSLISLINWIVFKVSFGKLKELLPFDFKTLGEMTDRMPDFKQVEQKIDKAQSFVAAIAIVVLSVMTAMANTHWNLSKNPKILLAGQKHYYCQITSGYNQKRCHEILNVK